MKTLYIAAFNLPIPLAGGQRKIICGANEISWPPAGGVGMIFSAPVSIFNVLPQGGSFDYSNDVTLQECKHECQCVF